ncbi:MAG: 30S ribosomal protein S20 [Betaproteobacteria bacterium]|nr:30S ribosomal protein S20 [Betaproteobacteria bacterium]
MANSAQAKKRARQAAELRLHNMAQRSAYRTAVKKVRKAIDAGDKTAAQAALNENMSVMDRLADKRIVHKNKASRHKSRLSDAIKAMA